MVHLAPLEPLVQLVPLYSWYHCTVGTVSTVGTISTIGTVGTVSTVGKVGTVSTVGTVGTVSTVGTDSTVSTVGTVGTVGTATVTSYFNCTSFPVLVLNTSMPASVHFNASYAANLSVKNPAPWVPVAVETLAPVKGKASPSDITSQSLLITLLLLQ